MRYRIEIFSLDVLREISFSRLIVSLSFYKFTSDCREVVYRVALITDQHTHVFP